MDASTARSTVGLRRAGALALAVLFWQTGVAHGQAGEPGFQVAPSQSKVIVMAGETSPSVSLRVAEPSVARTVRTHTFVVQLPPALAGHVAAQPASISVSIPPGQREGQAPVRFATQPTAPAGTHAVAIATADGRLATRIALEIRPPARAPAGAEPQGEVEVIFVPIRLPLCEGGDAVTGTIRLRGLGGYRGAPTLSWMPSPGLVVSPTALRSASLPPDREIPFEVSARGAAPGSHTLAVAAVDPASGTRTEARTTVTVEAPGFTARAAPAALSVRQGGPDAALTVTVEPNRCFGRQQVRVVVTDAPGGLEVSVPPTPVPYPNIAVGVRASASAAVGRHTIGIEIADAGRRDGVRHALRVPVSVEPAAVVERARTPRIERVDPPTLAPGERATLELTGVNLGPGVTLEFEPTGIQVMLPPIFHSPTRATVEVQVPRGARAGPRKVVASSAAGRVEGPAELRIEAERLAVREPRAPPEAEPAPEEPGPEPVPEQPEPEAPEEPEPDQDPLDPPGEVERLDFGGFILAVTGVQSPDLDAFAGEGLLQDFVFAGRLQTVPMSFDFEGLELEPTTTAGLYTVLSGEALREKAVNLSLPTLVAGLGVQITRMELDPDGARIDGRVFLPFVDHEGPKTDLLAGIGGAGEDTPMPDGFAVIPAYDWGDMMPGTGGAAVITYGGVPLSDGLSNTVLVTEAIPVLDAPPAPFDVAVVTGAPAGSLTFTDQPLGPDGDFLYTGFAEIDSHAIGATGVSFRAQQGLEVVVDLSTSANGNQTALDAAYLPWEITEGEAEGMGIGLNFGDVSSPPGVPHTSPQWMGLVFPDAGLSAPGIGIHNTTSHVAWVAAGFQTLLAKSMGGATETVTAYGWEVELLNAAFGIKNSVLVDAGALGDVHLPLFGEKLRVSLKMTNGGTPSMKALAPVARLYGHTAVIGEGAAFFWHQGELKLGFNDARWAFNGDLSAPQPQAPAGRGDHPYQIGEVFAALGVQTSLEFLNNNYKRQFHLKMLTLRANGAADLKGQTRRSLATIPSLDFLGYPFLDGGAWILLEQQGTTYTLGLEGNLELAGNLGGLKATTRYKVQNGQEQTWTFEGALDASVKVVHLDLAVGGEVDLVTKDLFFHANGGFTIEELFHFDAAGAFGRQAGTRYWYVYASVDLQGTPIVDTGFLAFYSFKGGVAHNLAAATSGTCGILDPIAFAQNANQCVDGNVDWTFLAGTVLAPSEGYGGDRTVHIDGTLVISSQGSVDILGQAWMMRSFSEGYAANAPPQAAAHVGINKNRFVMTACVGPSGSSQGAPESAQTISCEGLEPLKYPKAVPVVEIRGWSGFLLDWSNHTYYLAVGHYSNRVQARFFGLAYRQGYMVLAYSPSVPSTWLPPLAGGQVGFYAGRQAGYEWNFEYAWGKICDNKVWAYASLGSESNFFLEFVPFALYADVYYWVNMGVGAQVCGLSGSINVAGDLGGSVYVSQQLGELTGTFGGHVLACGKNKCLVLVKIPDLNVKLTLWQA